VFAHSFSRLIGAAALLAFTGACSTSHDDASLLPQASSNVAARATLQNDASIAGSGNDVVAEAVSPSRAGVRDLGEAPANTVLDLAVTLRYRNQIELDRLVANQQTASSPQYRQWLSNEAFNARFAPLQSGYRRVIASLQRAGFRVTATYANRTVLDTAGTVAQIERYFGTHVHAGEQPGRGRRYANISPAKAPADLRGTLLAVDGLSTVIFVSPFHRSIAPGTATGSIHSATKSGQLFGPPSSSTGAQGYAPLAFSTAYDLPVVHPGGADGHYDGAGRSAAIVIDSDFTNSDLSGFLKYFAIRHRGAVTRVPVDGGALPGDEGLDAVEATLDTETLAANAPGVHIYVYELPSLAGNDITDAYDKIVSGNLVDAASSSFGGCETLLGQSATAWSAIAEQALAKGLTFVASSGDGGGVLCPSSPASSPYVVAVGGTALDITTKGTWMSEVGWTGSGGGISTVFAAPVWQSGVPGINARGRNLPDMALDSDPYSGAAFYYTKSWNTIDNPIGGTSLASPLYLAALTEMDEVRGQRLGLSSGKLFGQWKSNGYGAAAPYFHDITLGNNGVYYTLPGYDLVTGIGSIDAWNIAESM
jgi:subtilase family serine protease